jgi:hypothetical protein
MPWVTADNLPNGGPLRHQFKARARIPDLIFQWSSSAKSSEKVSSCPLNLDGKKEKTFILFNHSECQLFREWRQILASWLQDIIFKRNIVRQWNFYNKPEVRMITECDNPQYIFVLAQGSMFKISFAMEKFSLYRNVDFLPVEQKIHLWVALCSRDLFWY